MYFGPILEDRKCTQLLWFLNIPMLRSGVMEMVFINECKYYEIRDQMFFNIIFSFSETSDILVMA